MNKTNPSAIVSYKAMGMDNVIPQKHVMTKEEEKKQLQSRVKEYLNVLDVDNTPSKKSTSKQSNQTFNPSKKKSSMLKSFSPTKGDMADSIFFDGFDNLKA